MKKINENSVKRNKVKNFSVSLTCTILSRSEFDRIYRYYDRIGSSCTARKVDMGYNIRLFYKVCSYTSLRSLYYDITYGEYLKLPRFVCVESVKI